MADVYKATLNLSTVGGADPSAVTVSVRLLEASTADLNDGYSTEASINVAGNTIVSGNNTFTFSTPYTLVSGKYYYVYVGLQGSAGTMTVYGTEGFIEPFGSPWESGGACGAILLNGSDEELFTIGALSGTSVGLDNSGPFTTSKVTTIGYEYAATPEKATTPFPTDAETGVVNNNENLTLTWVDGGEGEANAATSYDVWFGTLSLSKVAEGIADLEYVAGELNELTEYQWRIDSINDAGTTTGDVWTFTTSGTRGLGKAIVPTPTTEATGIAPTLESVLWQNGGGASTYDIYFGPASDELTKIDTVDATGQAIFTSETFSAGKFPIGGSDTFYWRIDANNYFGNVTGDVWEFTTSVLRTPDFTSGGGGGRGVVAGTHRLVVAAANKIFYEDT